MPRGVLVVSPWHRRYAEELKRQAPGVRAAGCAGAEDAPADLSPFDAALAWKIDNALLERWPALEWIQLVSAGADHILSLPALRPGVAVTSARGVHAKPIADYAMMMLSALSMGLKSMMANQAERRWKPWGWRNLEGRALCQVGMGAIGREIARRAGCAGMRVLGVSRSGASGADEADSLFPAAEIEEAIGRADCVVLAVPHTPETKALMNAKRLAAMKPGAHLVNVARGETLDEDALVRALDSGHLAGAALDVFPEEPLPADSPLWGVKNLIITPHVSGLARDYIPRVCRVFVENHENRARGRPLKNLIDRERGY